MVEPGLVPITQWGPEDADDEPIDAYGPSPASTDATAGDLSADD
jgi:hypothetical protein